MSDISKLAALLADRQVDFTYQIYPGVGHSFVRLSELEPGHETSAAALDEWERTLSFLRSQTAA